MIHNKTANIVDDALDELSEVEEYLQDLGSKPGAYAEVQKAINIELANQGLTDPNAQADARADINDGLMSIYPTMRLEDVLRRIADGLPEARWTTDGQTGNAEAAKINALMPEVHESVKSLRRDGITIDTLYLEARLQNQLRASEDDDCHNDVAKIRKQLSGGFSSKQGSIANRPACRLKTWRPG